MKEQTPTEILIKIAKILDDLKIPYYVTGGFAVSLWGRPRFTADIDLIIKMAAPQKTAFAKKMTLRGLRPTVSLSSLKQASIPVLKSRVLRSDLKKLFPASYLDLEQIETALARKGEFNFIEPETGLKIDFWLAENEPFEEECFHNRKMKNIGYKVAFISPEDLIISKLLWYKETGSNRHLEDAKTVLEISKVNKKILKNWAHKLELISEFENLI